MDKIIWQPGRLYDPGYEFEVFLDREFAQKMVSAKLPEGRGKKLNDGIAEIIGKRAFDPHIIFFKDTALAMQYNLGDQGRWLAISETMGRNPLEAQDKGMIKYVSHNVDTSTDRDTLLRMFNIYTEYSDLIIKK